MAQIENIEGIGTQYAEKLKAAGIGSMGQLLESGGGGIRTCWIA